MSKFSWVFAAGMLLASVGTSNAATILNGSFERGVVNGGFETLNSTSTLLQNWTVGGTIDFIGNYWAASNGAQSLDMDGNSAGSVSQDITGLVAGDVYKVFFDLSGNPDSGNPTKGLSVAVAGAGSALYSFVTGANSHSNMGWVRHFFSFTATSATQKLTFASTDTTGSAWGPALDNVSVVSTVPLPAGAPLLLAGLAGLAALRRRKSV